VTSESLPNGRRSKRSVAKRLQEPLDDFPWLSTALVDALTVARREPREAPAGLAAPPRMRHENAMFLIQRFKDFFVRCFGCSEKEMRFIPACIAEHAHHSFLKLTLEVNQEISTGDEMHARKWRIAQDVVGRKYKMVTYFTDYAVMVILVPKITIQS